MEKKSWVKCVKCGSYINMDTNRIYTECACRAIAVDGDGYYTRIVGNSDDWRIVPSNKKEN